MCCDANHTNAQAGMEESLVEIGSLVRRHTSIFASFTVEDEVCGDESATYECSAVKEALAEVACIWRRNGTGSLLV